MIPVKTFVGLYKKKDLQKIFKKKKVIIWGTGPIARETFCCLIGHKIKVHYFIDDRILNNKHSFLNRKILNFENVKNLNFQKYFIIIAATEYKKQANNYLCKKLGLKKNINYCNWLKIARPHAVINFVKNKALSYKKIYSKIKKEIPFISKIEIWFSDNYNQKEISFKDFLSGDKSFLNSFNIKMSQLEIIKKLRKLKNSQIYFHLGDEVGEDVNIMTNYNQIYNELKKEKSVFNNKNLKKNLNFFIYPSKVMNKNKISKITKLLKDKQIIFWLCDPYIMPYDKILNNLIKFKNIKKLYKIYKNFNFNIYEYLKLSLKSKNKPCLCQRVFPIINNDNTLKHCPLYEEPILSKNAMGSDLIKEKNSRSKNSFCAKCQNYSLHRFDLKVLDNEYKKNNELRV